MPDALLEYARKNPITQEELDAADARLEEWMNERYRHRPKTSVVKRVCRFLGLG
ncbi:MAG: hypothetical protein FWF24_05175 [Alphaproteobacteria bacterium]|nr:hypothetical protein [Alphaproteobacteria bacterium]